MNMIGTQHPYIGIRDLQFRSSSFVLKAITGLCYTYDGRGAIFQVCSQIKSCQKDTVLVPKFHCPTVVDPILCAGFKVRYYTIDSDLKIDLEDLYNKLDDKVQAVVVIHYFGFETEIDDLKKCARKNNFFVIEDWAHSFLRNSPVKLAGSDSSINVYSFKKLTPIGTGGGYRLPACLREMKFSSKPCGIKDNAVICKDIFDQAVAGGRNRFLTKVQRYINDIRKKMHKRNVSTSLNNNGTDGESVYPFHMNLAQKKMPHISNILLHLDNMMENIETRQRNFKAYLQQLNENKYLSVLHHDLADDTVPWSFPIIVPNRKNHDFRLRENGVPLFTFGELLHPDLLRASSNFKTSEAFLSNALIQLPIHRNLDSSAIGQICKTINQYFDQLP